MAAEGGCNRGEIYHLQHQQQCLCAEPVGVEGVTYSPFGHSAAGGLELTTLANML
jgi:hypothetical protein